jgi:hypothetical protein
MKRRLRCSGKPVWPKSKAAAEAGPGSWWKSLSAAISGQPWLLTELCTSISGSHQIFRIDHYLAKETVQNVLMLRFANAIFEPLWNRNYIDSISITAAESIGVENRAGYYEQSGVLRDMFQNHMMQLFALTAMEPPPFSRRPGCLMKRPSCTGH